MPLAPLQVFAAKGDHTELFGEPIRVPHVERYERNCSSIWITDLDGTRFVDAGFGIVSPSTDLEGFEEQAATPLRQ